MVMKWISGNISSLLRQAAPGYLMLFAASPDFATAIFRLQAIMGSIVQIITDFFVDSALRYHSDHQYTDRQDLQHFKRHDHAV